MVDHVALGVDPAVVSQAGAHTLVVDAGLAGGAVLVDLALASAAQVRVAEESGRALARAALPGGRGDGVLAAGVGHARVDRLGLGAGAARAEGVADVVGQALAHDVVVDDEALGVVAARAGARVAALLVDAGHVAGTLGVHGTFRPGERV